MKLTNLSQMSCFLVACFFALIPSTAVSQGQEGVAESPFVVAQECSFVDSKFSVNVDLGLVPAGKTVKAKLLVRNDGADKFVFEKAKPNCSCTDFSIDKTTILAGEVAIANVEFEVPEGNSSHSHSAHIDFQVGGEVVGRLVAHCRIMGSLQLGNAQHVFSVAPGVAEYRVPIYFSDPIKFENLESSLEGTAFEGVELTHGVKRNSSGQAYLSVMVPSSDLKSRFMSGVFSVHDKTVGRVAATHLLVTKRNPVDIAPSSLRFKATDDGDVWEASALIRLFLESEDSPNKESERELEAADELKLSDARIDASFSGSGKLNLKVKRLSDTIYRVVLQVSGGKIRTDDVVSWTVKVGEVEYELETPVYGEE